MTPVIETEQRSSDSLSAYGIARSTIAGSPLSRIGAKKDRRLLASMQLPGARHDLSSGQSASERAAQARAHQEPASGPLGVEPRTGVHVCPSEPSDQEIRPQHDLHGRPRTRCAGSSGAWLS